MAFGASGTTTRSIAFGTGQIYLTGNNATIWAAASVSNFSYTGTPIINCNYSGSVGTRTVNAGSSFGNETNALTFNITAGSDIFTFATSSYIKSLNLTGFSGTFSNVSFTLYGNLIVPSGVTLTAGANTVIFGSTLTQQNITSNSISPSFMHTGLTVNTDERIIEGIKESHPFKELLTISEVSDAVFFLSNCSQQINGVNLIMNAGAHVV